MSNNKYRPEKLKRDKGKDQARPDEPRNQKNAIDPETGYPISDPFHYGRKKSKEQEASIEFIEKLRNTHIRELESYPVVVLDQHDSDPYTHIRSLSKKQKISAAVKTGFGKKSSKKHRKQKIVSKVHTTDIPSHNIIVIEKSPHSMPRIKKRSNTANGTPITIHKSPKNSGKFLS